MRCVLLSALGLAFSLLVAPRPALATPFGFCVTNHSATHSASGEAQLSMNVSSLSAGKISFHFSNIGRNAAVIAGVHWDDAGSTLLDAIASIVDGPGVSFSANGSPPVLAGGGSIAPPFIGEFCMNADKPPPKSGVGPGETLDVIFNLKGGVTPAEVIAGINFGELRVGLHVIVVPNGGRESFVDTPEPTPAALSGAALFGLSVLRRNRL